MIALNLGTDNRILSACIVLPNGNYDGMPIVGELPDGDVTDYRYISKRYVYDPIPKTSMFPIAPQNIIVGECITVDGVMYKATTNIPNGATIIEGQNAVVTTVEEQLYELTKGE